MSEYSPDAIAYAAQLGRLDLISTLLAVIGIGLGLAAIYAFFHFRSVAKNQAEKTAAQVAREVAEKEASLYLQKELAVMVAEYQDILNTDEEVATRIANQGDDMSATTDGDKKV